MLGAMLLRRRPCSASGRARADVALAPGSPRTTRVPIRPGSRSSMTAPCSRRTRMSTAVTASVCANGWRRGGSGHSPLVSGHRDPDQYRPGHGRMACPSRARGGQCRHRSPVRSLRRQRRWIDAGVHHPSPRHRPDKGIEVGFIAHRAYRIGKSEIDPGRETSLASAAGTKRHSSLPRDNSRQWWSG